MNELLSQFHFVRPWWLLALIPAAMLIWALWQNRQMSQSWQKYISPNLLPFLLDGAHLRQKTLPLLGGLAIWVAAIIALAGPVWEKIPVPVQRNSSALIICWDLSPSMLAEDIKPSRLVKSRLKIIDLLNAKQDGQAGLIAYSGEAYVVTPLTDDFQTIVNLLPALAPNTLPSVGSNPEMAVKQARDLLKDAGVISGHILLMTDELTDAARDNIENALYKSPHQLTMWTIGTPEGAPIPLPQGGFAKDSRDEIVVAQLNEKELQNFSRSIGAYMVPMVNTDSDVETIIALTEPASDQAKQVDRLVEQWFEIGQFLPVFLLPFSLLLFRRGFLWAIILVPLLYPPPSLALSWQDLWQTQNQQAQQALEKGDKDAAMRFEDPSRRGVELFKQGQYESAADQFSMQQDAEAAYNLGTSRVHAGDYQGAIDAFKDALNKQPDFPKAQENLDIAEQLLKLAEQSPDSSNDESNSSSDQQSSQDNEGDQSSEQNNQQQGSNSSAGQQQQDSQNDSGNSSEDPQQTPHASASAAASSSANPFATGSSDGSQASQSSQDIATEANSSAPEQSSSSDSLMQQPIPENPQQRAMTEEEQMLEQWLRKVPDDPSGLMRNKFRYQYLQRREKLGDQFNPNQESAEQRW